MRQALILAYTITAGLEMAALQLIQWIFGKDLILQKASLNGQAMLYLIKALS